MSHLRALAEKYNCAIVLIEHLNKNIGGKGLHRGLGSIDITAAARSILMLGSDPGNESDKGVAHIKSNCGMKGKVIGFSIGKGGLVWNPNTALTADVIQGYVRAESESSDNKLEEAKEFLEDVLKDGKQSHKDIMVTAKQHSISDATLRRAKEDLRIETEREGFGRGSTVYWKLPYSVNAFHSVEKVTPDEEAEILSIFDTPIDAQALKECEI